MGGKNSIAYRDWRSEYLRKPIVDELEYYLAQLAAERLLAQGVINVQEFLCMIQDSNAALSRFKEELT